mgnify:FL=1
MLVVDGLNIPYFPTAVNGSGRVYFGVGSGPGRVGARSGRGQVGSGPGHKKTPAAGAGVVYEPGPGRSNRLMASSGTVLRPRLRCQLQERITVGAHASAGIAVTIALALRTLFDLL